MNRICKIICSQFARFCPCLAIVVANGDADVAHSFEEIIFASSHNADNPSSICPYKCSITIAKSIGTDTVAFCNNLLFSPCPAIIFTSSYSNINLVFAQIAITVITAVGGNNYITLSV